MSGINATYVAENEFSITGNQTEVFNTGRRVECTCSGIKKYGTVISSSYTDPNTLITLTTTSDNLNEGLTIVHYGIQSGAIGSLPQHYHSTSEGDGGNLTSSGTASTILTDWTVVISGSLYYTDFNHNLNTDDISVFLIDTDTNKEVGVEEIEILSVNAVRIYITDNTSSIKVNVITGGYGTGYESFSPDNITYVAKNGSDSTPDGSRDNPFLTITAANAYAIANKPSYPMRGIVSVAPGIYTDEHLTTSHYRIHIIGQVNNLDHRERPVILANTGVDSDHYPLAVGKALNLENITIATMDETYYSYVSGVFGPIGNTSQFSNCTFKGGYFIEQEEVDATNVVMNFHGCYMNGDAFKIQGTSVYNRFIALRECDLYNGNPIFTCSGTGTKVLKVENTLLGSASEIKGDWSLLMQGAELYSDGSLTFDTNGYIDIFNSIIANGIHFVSDTSDTKKIVSNYFRNITSDTDITVASGINIEIVDFSGNKMCQGLGRGFRIAGGQRNIGGFAENKYTSLQGAIYSIPAGESGTITLHEDETGLDELILNAGSKVSIQASKKYNLTFTGNVVTLSDNQELTFDGMAYLDGGKAEINGDGAILSFENCLTAQCSVVTTSGVDSMVITYFSSLRGVTGYPVIEVNNTDTTIVSGYSRVKSATGQPAIELNAQCHDRLKIKYSSLIHIDGGTNRPLVYNGTGSVDVAVYSTAMNTAFDPSDIHNVISSSQNIIDAEISF